MISKQQYEAQLRQVFKLLLEGKTQEEIALELHIGVRSVSRYCSRIDQRYGQIQAQKTDNTLFTEVQLFRHRMLHLYRSLEKKVEDPKISGMEAAKCCEVAANIANNLLRLESEYIKAVKQGLVSIGQGATTNKNNAPPLNNLRKDDVGDDDNDNSSTLVENI